MSEKLTGGGAACEVPQYDSEVERLCAYLKNDSLVRWHTGCSQADIDHARARLARRRKPSKEPYISKWKGGGESDERRAAKRARDASAALLQALQQAGANG